MASVDNGNPRDETEEFNGTKVGGQIPLQISASRRTLLSTENSQRKSYDSLISLPNGINFLKFGSASAKFRQLAQERDEFSRSVTSSSSHGFRERTEGKGTEETSSGWENFAMLISSLGEREENTDTKKQTACLGELVYMNQLLFFKKIIFNVDFKNKF
jgi:hypothetical protein